MNTVQTLLTDLRILSAVILWLLGLTFLLNATRAARPYARWLAGSGFVLGFLTMIVRSLELFGVVDIQVAGPLGSLIGIGCWAALLTGLRTYFEPARTQPARLFVVLLCIGLVALGLVIVGGGSRPFAGPVAVAVLLTATAGWLLFDGWGRRPDGLWRTEVLVGLAMLGIPMALVLALIGGLTLQQYRQLNQLPLLAAYVLVLTLILQRDVHTLNRELRQRRQAERDLKHLTETLEHQVAERTAQLSEVVQGLQSFTGMVSHDLRGPLGNVANLTDLARHAAAAGDAAQLARWLDLIGRESARAAEMVSDLLTLAQVERGPPQRVDTDMNALVADCVHALSVAFPGAAAAVRADALPQVAVDAALMRHAVTNLLGNALKFGAGRDDLRVTVSAKREAAGWRFEVADNGDGFDAARVGELFKPFSRLGRRDVAGTGLGLTVVQRVIERHGGRVGASSAPGAGATFWWTLPAPMRTTG